MKSIFLLVRRLHAVSLCCGCVVFAIMASMTAALGQGTIVFNGQVSVYGTNYYEQGMLFRVIIPTPGSGSPSYDSMGIIPPNTYNNYATNGTPYLAFSQLLNPSDYVIFSLTNGYTFGLTSAYLGDPLAPSPSAVPIMFVGYLANGSTVTNTFTTPGNNANNLLNYTFTSAFASGLTSVDIFATRWAMDNLVFGNVSPVPEPGVGSLITVGLLAFLSRKIKARHKP